MNRIKVSLNFHLDELVDPVTYFTEEDHGLSKLDPKAINVLQAYRDLKKSSITVNNWWDAYWKELKENPKMTVEEFSEEFKGYQWSGFRSAKCKIGAKASAHKLGKAFDPKGDEDEYFKLTLKHSKLLYDTGLRRVEDPKITKGWFHIDTNDRNCEEGKINVVDLKKVVHRIKAVWDGVL